GRPLNVTVPHRSKRLGDFLEQAVRDNSRAHTTTPDKSRVIGVLPEGGWRANRAWSPQTSEVFRDFESLLKRLLRGGLGFAPVAARGGHQHAQRGVVAEGPNARVTEQEVGDARVNAAEAEVVVSGRGTAAGPHGAEAVGHVAARPARQLV